MVCAKRGSFSLWNFQLFNSKLKYSKGNRASTVIDFIIQKIVFERFYTVENFQLGGLNFRKAEEK